MNDFARDLGRLEGRLGAMEDRLEKIDAILERIDERLGRIEATDNQLLGAGRISAWIAGVVGAVIALLIEHFWG